MTSSRYKINHTPKGITVSARVVQNLPLYVPVRFTLFISNWRLA